MLDKIFTLLFLSFISLGINAQNAQLESVINEIKKDYRYQNAMIEAVVFDAKTGEKIYGVNENIAVAPASVTKLFATAASVLSHADTRLTTRFYTDGEVIDSILKGNLWIRGGGDPTLGSEYYTKEEDDTFLIFS